MRCELLLQKLSYESFVGRLKSFISHSVKFKFSLGWSLATAVYDVAANRMFVEIIDCIGRFQSRLDNERYPRERETEKETLELESGRVLCQGEWLLCLHYSIMIMINLFYDDRQVFLNILE